MVMVTSLPGVTVKSVGVGGEEEEEEEGEEEEGEEDPVNDSSSGPEREISHAPLPPSVISVTAIRLNGVPTPHESEPTQVKSDGYARVGETKAARTARTPRDGRIIPTIPGRDRGEMVLFLFLRPLARADGEGMMTIEGTVK